jgi:hypothetical protein
MVAPMGSGHGRRAVTGVLAGALLVQAATVSGARPAAGHLPGAPAIKVCAAAGPFWPTMTLALQGSTAWVACKEQSRLVKVDLSTRKVVRSVALGGSPIAVAAGAGALWAVDSSSTLYRISPSSAKVTARTSLPVSAAYNVWIGAGSLWVADDQGGQVVRVSPTTRRVVARIPVGDGPADIAFGDGTAWVMNHRDRVLTRIDLASNRSEPLLTLGDENVAPERMVYARGHLWITGRGADLYDVDPAAGKLVRTIEIGASGIDVATDGQTLWVPTRSAATDVRGFPTMDALVRVSTATGAVSTAAHPSGRLDVHGIAVAGGRLWLADNTGGMLYRVG